MMYSGVNALRLGMPQGGETQPTPAYYDANNVWQWDPYTTGGATRPDTFTGMDDGFRGSLEQFYASMPPEIRDQTQITSGYRSNQRQQELWDAAVEKYGDPEIADNWVARPGGSQHEHGNAADLKYLSPEAQAWAHANAANYGLAFPLGNEPWHIEPVGARNGAPASTPPRPAGATAPQMPAPPQQQQPPQVDPVQRAFAAMMRSFQSNNIGQAFKPLRGGRR